MFFRKYVGEGSAGKIYRLKRKKNSLSLNRDYVIKHFSDLYRKETALNIYASLKKIGIKRIHKFFKNLNESEVVMPNLNIDSRRFCVSANDFNYKKTKAHKILKKLKIDKITGLKDLASNILSDFEKLSSQGYLCPPDVCFFLLTWDEKTSTIDFDYIFGDYDSVYNAEELQPKPIFEKILADNTINFLRSLRGLLRNMNFENSELEFGRVKEYFEEKLKVKISFN